MLSAPSVSIHRLVPHAIAMSHVMYVCVHNFITVMNFLNAYVNVCIHVLVCLYLSVCVHSLHNKW